MFIYFQDPNANKWWLKVGDNSIVGHWPGELFDHLTLNGATLAEWGGQVYSPDVKKTPHTTASMGSRNYAFSLHGNACYIKEPRVVDFSSADSIESR